MKKKPLKFAGVARLEKQADKVAMLLGAMANSRRLLVLCHLVDGERSVGDLAETVGLSLAALSQHLAKLRAQGVVATRRQGQTIFYRLASNETKVIIGTLYGLFCGPKSRAPK